MTVTSGVSKISFRGGFKIILEKWGYLQGASRHAARGKVTRLLGPRGVRGMLPRGNFKKWCNLVSFREYFAKFCQKNNFKNSHFYMNIIDNVLLRTIFRGIGAYSPDFLSIVRFGVFWSKVSVNFLLRKYYNYLNSDSDGYLAGLQIEYHSDTNVRLRLRRSNSVFLQL